MRLYPSAFTGFFEQEGDPYDQPQGFIIGQNLIL